MKKFFFDDVRDSPGADWIVARDVSEARHALVRGAFDVMSLDHDIGMQMMCEQCHDEIPRPVTQSQLKDKLKLGCFHKEHGTDLARWMVHNLPSWPKLIIIHSANPYGAKRMKSILGRYAEVKVIHYDHCKYDRIPNTKSAYWIVACCGLAVGIVGLFLAWARR